MDPTNDNTGAEEADEEGQPTALPCFGGSSGDTPSSPCPEPRSRNLRGRRPPLSNFARSLVHNSY